MPRTFMLSDRQSAGIVLALSRHLREASAAESSGSVPASSLQSGEIRELVDLFGVSSPSVVTVDDMLHLVDLLANGLNVEAYEAALGLLGDSTSSTWDESSPTKN